MQKQKLPANTFSSKLRKFECWPRPPLEKILLVKLILAVAELA